MKKGPTGGDPGDFFGGMFGGKEKGPKKNKSVIHPIKCTLEDLYNGKSTKIKINRDRLCTACSGKGGENSNN